MSYVFVQDVPIDDALYAHITENLGPTPPKGLIVHIATRTANGLRYVDVWESQEALDTFTDGRLHPAVGKAFKQAGVPFPDQEPPRVEQELVHVWLGEAHA